MVGAGVVGCAAALALVRRGAAVALVEREPVPGLAASGTNSGIVHTGFDSKPGELETRLILRSAELRDAVIDALGVPVIHCGAELRAAGEQQEPALAGLARNAAANGVTTTLDRGVLSVPGESVTDPVAYTLGLASAAERAGAAILPGFEVTGVAWDGTQAVLQDGKGAEVRAKVLVNCAGLHADAVSALAGGERFEIYPRKGEFAVFDPPFELDRILLPVPEPGTKGVLVFPTVDGKVVAGPTARDQEDKTDWSVRPDAIEEVVAKAARLLPELEGLAPVATYAGLRPAGRGFNYLVERSRARPGLIQVAAIRSTGLTASLGIAERVCELVAGAGVGLGDPGAIPTVHPAPAQGPWWRRTADFRAEP